MESKHILIILVILIVVIGVAVGVMFMPSSNAHKDSKITVTSNKTLYKGDNLTVKLTDLNKTPIKKAKVNVTITDKNGKVVANKTLKTNSKGAAHMKVDLGKGKYTVNVTFAGDANYTGNNTTQKLTIKQKETVTEQPVVQQESSSESSEQSSDNDVVGSRDFVSWDYAPGYRIQEKTYANGDVERDIEGGYHTYYDSSEHVEYYTNPDGSSGSMYVGN